MLEVNGVIVKYGNRQILNQVNLRAEKGKFVGIIGPNGSGKTTLVKTINNIIKPNGGSITVDGRSLDTMSSVEIAKNIAMVSQVISINFEFTVEDVVLMGRTPYIKGAETHEDMEIVQDAMKKTKIIHLKDRFVTQLSGGELQKVIIARALAQDPKILLLDEPTSHLDITNQIDILNLVKDASRKGMLVIAVMHDLNLAAYYCDKIYLLRDGDVISSGTPDEVLTPSNIKTTYNIDVEVINNQITNSLYVIPRLEPLGKKTQLSQRDIMSTSA
ncbi:heme ABC transporter ATP-binding protein [Methanococcoides seepicolus]|jgi:iron complex transport system ATP-binding protein|uniref:Cobalamin import ATP-binding protein BtuD n=1 Tax=Methanococcoides seepicolus TaxID=2828780 RepID=A0A9E5DBT1_9EURY|nr:heme ABC transporter ATP-binding protein [Methanococcoides seepicolus]MCM1987910.1 heme ABC transporter ATP-binding protein [Methanococcoides seepicolus]